jgi:hypothetical protein
MVVNAIRTKTVPDKAALAKAAWEVIGYFLGTMYGDPDMHITASHNITQFESYVSDDEVVSILESVSNPNVTSMSQFDKAIIIKILRMMINQIFS